MPRTHDVSRTRRTSGKFMDRPDPSPAVEISWQPPEWMTDGSCAQPGVDSELWFADPRSDDTKEARSVCAHCPVIAECLQYALDKGITDGTWGGLDEVTLRRIARKRTEPGTKRRRSYHTGPVTRKRSAG